MTTRPMGIAWRRMPRCVAGAVLAAAGAWHEARAGGGFDLTVPAATVAADDPPATAPGASQTTTNIDTSFLSGVLSAWRAASASAESTQPQWGSPLVTTTGLLKQRLRFDIDRQRAGNGTSTTLLDGGKGLDLIVTPTTEIQIAAAPYSIRSGHAGSGPWHVGTVAPLAGWGDWAFLRIEQRLAASPESGGNYVVTTWLQIAAPTGLPQLSSNAWAFLPTLAFGKGWGHFVVQGTVGVTLPTAHAATLGHPVQTHLALQYHVRPIFWPELEVNWTYAPDGQRGGLSQVFLVPGLVLSTIRIGRGLGLSLGAGYQVAVATPYRAKPLTPSFNRGWLFTARLNF